MSFESGPSSLEKNKEIPKLPPDIIEVCEQLDISPERRDILAGLPYYSQEPIFATLITSKGNLNGISKWKQEQFASVVSGNPPQS